MKLPQIRKISREIGAGLLDSSLKIRPRVQKELEFPPCPGHRRTSVAAFVGQSYEGPLAYAQSDGDVFAVVCGDPGSLTAICFRGYGAAAAWRHF